VIKGEGKAAGPVDRGPEKDKRFLHVMSSQHFRPGRANHAEFIFPVFCPVAIISRNQSKLVFDCRPVGGAILESNNVTTIDVLSVVPISEK